LTGASRSLLDFVDAPVVVGDPDGRAVYVNAAFERAFGTSAEKATGVLLASLFDGGAREAVLQAVAGVCGGDGTVRFRLREEGHGFAALASPIVAEADRVGVVILLTEELADDERLLAFPRVMQEPLDELSRCLTELAEGANSRAYRRHAEDGLRAVGRIRKQTEELSAVIQGGASAKR